MSTISNSLPKLSLCMIVKNERQNLPRCLASVKPYVEEMIVVDTGSEDGTPEIAAEYGAKVSHFEWCDDFAAARNYSISQASGDWILVLDADEELVVESEDFLEQLNLEPEIVVYALLLTDAFDPHRNETPTYVARLFRNTLDIRYVGRFHENVELLENYPFPFRDIKFLKIVHYGYSKKQLDHKHTSRNIPMLERIRQEEGLSLQLLYSLANMYFHTQQLEEAQECYTKIFELLLPNLIVGDPPKNFSRIPSLLYDLGMQAFENENYETAWLLCERGIEWCPNYPPLNYLAGVILSTLESPLEAVNYFKKCIQLGKEGNYYKGEPFYLIFITTNPAYNLGLMYINLERPQEALAAFELALSFDANFAPAREKVDKIRQFLGTQT